MDTRPTSAYNIYVQSISIIIKAGPDEAGPDGGVAAADDGAGGGTAGDGVGPSGPPAEAEDG